MHTKTPTGKISNTTLEWCSITLGGLSLLSYARIHGTNPLHEVREQFDRLAKGIPPPNDFNRKVERAADHANDTWENAGYSAQEKDQRLALRIYNLSYRFNHRLGLDVRVACLATCLILDPENKEYRVDLDILKKQGKFLRAVTNPHEPRQSNKPKASLTLVP